MEKKEIEGKDFLLIQNGNETYFVDSLVVEYIQARSNLGPIQDENVEDLLNEVHEADYLSLNVEDNGEYKFIRVNLNASPLEESVQRHLHDSYQMLQPKGDYQRRDPFRADLTIDTPNGTYTLDDLEDLEIHNFPRVNKLEE
ncbi:MAG: hypothetical protein ABIA37_00235 [Candidatus Woesearchaeota archaeon]